MNCSKVTRGCQKIGNHKRVINLLIYCHAIQIMVSIAKFKQEISIQKLLNQINITDSKYFPLPNISYVILYYEYVLSNARVILSKIT